MTIVIEAVEVAVVLNRCPPATSPRRDPVLRAQDHRDEPVRRAVKTWRHEPGQSCP